MSEKFFPSRVGGEIFYTSNVNSASVSRNFIIWMITSRLQTLIFLETLHCRPDVFSLKPRRIFPALLPLRR